MASYEWGHTLIEDHLSPRELEIARAYANGDTYHKIAKQLYIAPSTVRTHLAAIYRKLRISSKLDLHKLLNGAKPTYNNQDDQAALISELALSLDEAIGRERALSEALRIISRSGGEINDVIASVIGYTLDLCDAEFGILFECKPRNVSKATHFRKIPELFREWLIEQGEFEIGTQTGLGRMIANREVINIADVRAEKIYRQGDPLRKATAELGGARSFTAIPMLAGGRLIGAFTIYRQQVRPFDDKSLELARVFADQSAIAIENARLMSDLRAQNM